MVWFLGFQFSCCIGVGKVVFLKFSPSLTNEFNQLVIPFGNETKLVGLDKCHIELALNSLMTPTLSPTPAKLVSS